LRRDAFGELRQELGRGVLAVRAEGHERNLSFLCKSGHTYDVTERLVAKAPAEPVLPMAGSPADRADEP